MKSNFFTLKTNRLLLRPGSPNDAAIMHSGLIASFPLLQNWMPWAQTPATLEDTKRYLADGFLAWQNKLVEDLEYPIVILDLSEQKFLGATGIVPKNLEIPSFEIGYWVNQEYAKHGFITEATNALSRYLIEYLKAKRVQIKLETNNLASAKIAQRLNFNLEGVLKNSRLSANGSKISDTSIYAITDCKNLPALDYSVETL